MLSRLMLKLLVAVVTAAMLATLVFSQTAQLEKPKPADLILRNGLVYTVDPTNTLTEAVAIRDGKIIAVGASKLVMKLKGKETRVIDLKGNFVLPGFNDNHVHFSSAAAFLEFNIMRVATQQEFVGRVKEVVAQLPKGEWILGGYWGAYDQWAAGSSGQSGRQPFTPDMQAIEAITKEHPMFIRKFDDSEFAANSAALRAAGIDPANPQLSAAKLSAGTQKRPQGTEPAGSRSEGVEFVRDSGGRFNQHLRGRGVPALFASVIPPKFS